jgi:3-hydroxyisobutyrate dehydrogenase
LRIGFVGVGNMGGGMAANLARAGHEVLAFDLSRVALERARGAGCSIAASAEDAASGGDAVITMLPSGAHVRSVLVEQAFSAAPPGTLFIDSSTIDIATARAVAEAAEDAGHAMVDAPVSGGIAAAAAGTLTFMVGGTPLAFERAQPILAAMGKSVIHAGPAGSGQAAKICNNLLLGATMVATCEAFALARRLGLDLQTFYDISSRSSGQSWSMTSYCPVPGVGPESPADREYEGGFAAALMLKDLKLALEAAQAVNSSIPVGSTAEELYQLLFNLGGIDKDFSVMMQLIDGSWTAAARHPGS